MTLVYSFSCLIYDGRGQFKEYHKTLSRFIGMVTRKEVEKAIDACEKRRLDLSDEEVWHGAYLPPEGQLENQNYYEGFIKFEEIQLKLYHSGEPLIGAGKVVAWLTRSKSVYAPPETQDDMCFWRCLAAFFEIKDTRRLERAAEDLARRCLGRKKRKVSMEIISEVAQTVDITITVYHPTWQNGAVVCELRGKFGSGDQIMNIGIVEGHCYLIKDLEGLCKIWRCTKCGVAFNRVSNLKRHKAEVDCSPEPKVICEGNRVEGILSASDKVFYGTNSGASLKAAEWIASQEGPHIHHAFCGHGGERSVEVTLGGAKSPQKIRVDGYEPTTGTVYQYHGCYWHGCPCIDREGPGRGSLESTLAIDAAIAENHPMVVVWEHEVPNSPKIQFERPFHPYPGFIVYDFEARMKKVGEQKTEFYEVCAEHVPISVAISDNVTNEPVYLVDPDPKSLVTRFLQVLLEKREAILAKVTKMFPRPCDLIAFRTRRSGNFGSNKCLSLVSILLLMISG